MNIIKYAFYRLLAFLLQIIGSVAVIIAITSVISYDPSIFYRIASAPTGSEGSLTTEARTDEEIAQLSKEIGLDDSALERFTNYLISMFTRGDLGNSWYGDRSPVVNLYTKAFVTTLAAFGIGILIFTLLAIVLGILSARRINGTLDKNVRFSTSLFYSLPPFVLGTLLIIFTQAYYLINLPSRLKEVVADFIGYETSINPSVSPLISDFADAYSSETVFTILPIVTVVLIYTGFQFRLVRIYISEVLNKNYIRTAHAKGLGERTILVKHALRNALPELITSVAITFPVAFSGVVVLEKVYEISGSGLLLINAGLSFDWPVLIGGAVIFTSLNALILALSDLIINLVDPQLRLR